MVFALAMNYSAVASASPPSRRRDCSVDTLMSRRAATERGESWCLSASKVARTKLYGLEEPSDFATTSCMPRVSNTARIGPPAMMPVPGGAARRNTLAAPLRPPTSWCSGRPSRTGTLILVLLWAFVWRSADQVVLGAIGCLADRSRHFTRLTMAMAAAALLVADDDEGRKAE